MPDNKVNIRVGANLTDVDSAVRAEFSNLRASAEQAGPAISSAFGGANKSILSGRESARLLSEELGIHLPRAVSGAIAEILPGVASMGTALLGVFAVQEAAKFVEMTRKAADAFNEVAESEKIVKKISEENLSQMERMGKASEEYARDQLRLLNQQVVAGEARVKYLKDEEDGLHAMNPVLGQVAQAYYFWTGRSKELKEAESGLNQVLAVRDALIKVIGEDEAKAHHQAKQRTAAEVEFLIRVSEEGERSTKRLQRWHAEWLKSIGMPEEVKFSMEAIMRAINQNGLEAAKSLPTVTVLSATWQSLSAAQRGALPTLEQIKKVEEDLAKDLPNLTEAERKEMAQQLASTAAVRAASKEAGDHTKVVQDLTKAILQELVAEGKITPAYAKVVAESQGIVQANRMVKVSLNDLRQEFDKVSEAMIKQSVAAAIMSGNVGKAMKDAAAQAVASFAGEAGVNALKSAAYGAYYLAKYIGSWGTDAPALAASEAFFINATEWGAIGGGAGVAAHAIGGGGGAGAGGGHGITRGPMTGGAGGYGGGASGGYSGSSGAGAASLFGLAPGAATAKGATLASQAPSEITIHMNFNGPVVGGKAGMTELAKSTAAIISQKVVTAGWKVVASHVVNPAPISRGRT